METRSRVRVALWAVLATLLAAVAWSVCALAFATNAPFIEVPQGESSCVRDPVWMRYNHMTLLKQLRDEVVREGHRSELTLGSCATCHADRAQFCDRCHASVDLHPDCFDCHQYSETVP